ncbi:MAG: septum formation initiator family protein [Prolixibacteraceae bacterium]|nr:septum formation initiator family protein [Prolixibacteraceae bacterium]MBN2775488.1 septum formation initiator family protein [Prolixibacteraceae bacterium]
MKENKKSAIIKVVKNKFFITLFLFVIYLIFFDEYSIITRSKNKKQLENLTEQQEYYKDRIKADKQKLEELNSGIKELEKYAREQYNMTKPDEDLYIIVEE